MPLSPCVKSCRCNFIVCEMTPENRLKNRAVIQFCVNLGITPAQTLTMMNEASDEPTVKRMLVYKWHKRFSEGRDSICNDVGAGRPVSQTREIDVEAVKNIIDADRRVTLHEICKRFNDFQELQSNAQTLLHIYIYWQWVARHRRCVEANGAYFEKL